MSQSIGSSIGYSRKRLKRLKRPSLGHKGHLGNRVVILYLLMPLQGLQI